METKCWILNVMNYIVNEESLFSLKFYHKRHWNVKFSSLFTSNAHSLSPKIISSMVLELAKNKHIRRSLRRPTYPWLTTMCGSSIWDRTPRSAPPSPTPRSAWRAKESANFLRKLWFYPVELTTQSPYHLRLENCARNVACENKIDFLLESPLNIYEAFSKVDGILKTAWGDESSDQENNQQTKDLVALY
jgi:hypothetical protein